MQQKILYQMSYNENMAIHVTKGNKKVGKTIYTFNLLPGGNSIHIYDGNTILTNIKGTCRGCCSGCASCCYAVRDTRLHHNVVVKSSGENTLLMRHNLADTFGQLRNTCVNKNVSILRFHASGEIESYDYLLEMVQLAKSLPNTQFYFYTKRFEFVNKFIQENRAFPENLVCNLSVWKNNLKNYKFDGLNQFIWDDGTDAVVSTLPHCPAVSAPTHLGGKGHETGITCDKCGICWRKSTGHKIAVYNH
jgi:hypothetical protein